MARPRSPNRDKAYQLWLESGKTRQLKEIAAELGVSEEQVRKWKKHIPTYNPESFDLAMFSLEEVIHHMCVSELVHETIVVLSFVPLFAVCIWGEFYVFLITSILSAAFDTLFIILQRYNRPRLIRLLQRRR